MTVPMQAAGLAALGIVAAAAASAMPLQIREGEPAMGARPSNSYFGPGSVGGRNPERASEVDTAPQWMRDQEVMRVRAGETEFMLRMENVAGHDSLVCSGGSSQAAGFSHGIYAENHP